MPPHPPQEPTLRKPEADPPRGGRALPVVDEGETRGALRTDGKRDFVIPADVKGRYTTLRRMVFALLLVIYAALPWVQVGGHPAVFLDVKRRAFFLFGASFNAQDVWLAFFAVTGLGFALIVITTVLGRVWCGYACPQTVFLEGVFRRVERWIEGPKGKRLKRDRAGGGPKIVRKVAKHAAFIALALLVAHVLLSYFVSLPALFEMVRDRPSEHPEAFAWVMAITGALYFNFAWFREQLCLIICPYGRLQSVLTDTDTLVIGYDEQRGEPRGKKGKTTGDCVDCKRCLAVCPTSIDIREGLQIDCIGCANCVDACDEVMAKLGREPGLIRYDSLRGLTGGERRLWRPRLGLYAALGAIGLVVASFAVRAHEPFEANLLRLRGVAPFTLQEEHVQNAFELHLVNKRGDAARFAISAPEHAPGVEVTVAQPTLTVDAMGDARVPVFIRAPRDDPPGQVVLRIESEGHSREAAAPFVAPGAR